MPLSLSIVSALHRSSARAKHLPQSIVPLAIPAFGCAPLLELPPYSTLSFFFQSAATPNLPLCARSFAHRALRAVSSARAAKTLRLSPVCHEPPDRPSAQTRRVSRILPYVCSTILLCSRRSRYGQTDGSTSRHTHPNYRSPEP